MWLLFLYIFKISSILLLEYPQILRVIVQGIVLHLVGTFLVEIFCLCLKNWVDKVKFLQSICVTHNQIVGQTVGPIIGPIKIAANLHIYIYIYNKHCQMNSNAELPLLWSYMETIFIWSLQHNWTFTSVLYLCSGSLARLAENLFQAN